MSDFPDKSLREGVTKQAIASICAMLGFDYMRVAEVLIEPHTVSVIHMDEYGNITDTEIPVR